MKVRCGSCRTEFEVPGAGRYGCPACGSVNVVRGAADQPPPGGQQGGMGGFPSAPGVVPPPGAQPPPPPPEEPLPKVQCPECEFSFVVGKIATATCPNCSADVPTGIEEEGED